MQLLVSIQRQRTCRLLDQRKIFIVDKFFKSYNLKTKLLLPAWVQSSVLLFIQMGNIKTLTYSSCVVEYRPICLETKQASLWKPNQSASPSLQLRLSGLGLFRLIRKRSTCLYSSLCLYLYAVKAPSDNGGRFLFCFRSAR